MVSQTPETGRPWDYRSAKAAFPGRVFGPDELYAATNCSAHALADATYLAELAAFPDMERVREAVAGGSSLFLFVEGCDGLGSRGIAPALGCLPGLAPESAGEPSASWIFLRDGLEDLPRPESGTACRTADRVAQHIAYLLSSGRGAAPWMTRRERAEVARGRYADMGLGGGCLGVRPGGVSPRDLFVHPEE